MIQHSPAADRNVGVIGDVLAEVLPPAGLVVEIASGTGQHVIAFAQRFPRLQWQPSDHVSEALASIDARRAQVGLDNVRAPLAIDVTEPQWPIERADAIVCANMIHISPWSSTLGLFAGSARLLGASSPLVLYGPFLEHEVVTAPSNAAFDASLRARDSQWGIRWRDEVEAVAAAHGFERRKRVQMPANNLILVFAKA